MRGEYNSLATSETQRTPRVVANTKVVSHLQELRPWVKGIQNLNTYAELKSDPKASLPPAFTVCSTINSPAILDEQTPFGLLGQDGSNFMGSVHISNDIAGLTSGFYLTIGHGPDYAAYKGRPAPIVFPHNWSRHCLSLTTQSGHVQWAVDGQVVFDEVIAQVQGMAGNRPTDLTGRITLGTVLWSTGGWETKNNKVTNLNVFSSALPLERMTAMTVAGGKECGAAGDYLSWQESEWVLHGDAMLEDVEAETPCSKEPGMMIYMADFPGMASCMDHCRKLGERVPPVVTAEDWQVRQVFLEEAVYSKGKIKPIWLSIDDLEEEGVWKDYYNGKISNFKLPFTGTGPNGGDKENCVLQPTATSWVDWFCSDPEGSCVCLRTARPLVRLRGLCPGSLVNSLYLLMNVRGDPSKAFYVGNEDSTIDYDHANMQWVTSKTHGATVAVNQSPESSYVLGKHAWTISNDSYGCGRGEPYTTHLKLTGCPEGDFTCGDGQCIRMEERCDQLTDCRDSSDEKECRLLVLEDGYNKKVPPITTGANRTVMKAKVVISIDLLKIVRLEEVNHKIEFKFGIVLAWSEVRATYHNLKLMESLNALTAKEIEQLWVPYVIYDNTDMSEAVQLEDGLKTTITVSRDGAFTRSGPEVADEIEMFRGADNRLTMNQTYSKPFQCEYQLHRYPFDTQVPSSSYAWPILLILLLLLLLLLLAP